MITSKDVGLTLDEFQMLPNNVIKAMEHFNRGATLLTTKQAAAVLGIAARTVKDYCSDGVLKCTKLGRDWVIDERDLATFQQERKPRGRPRKKELG